MAPGAHRKKKQKRESNKWIFSTHTRLHSYISRREDSFLNDKISNQVLTFIVRSTIATSIVIFFSFFHKSGYFGKEKKAKMPFGNEYLIFNLFQCISRIVFLIQVDGTIVQLDEVSFSYPAKKETKNNQARTKNEDGTEKEKLKAPPPLRLESISVNMDQSTRMAILGRNGCGKSTLIKLITGALEPTGKNCRHMCKIIYLKLHI